MVVRGFHASNTKSEIFVFRHSSSLRRRLHNSRSFKKQKEKNLILHFLFSKHGVAIGNFNMNFLLYVRQSLILPPRNPVVPRMWRLHLALSAELV